jgi:polysaccharide pyruvyl transferase CsaB
VGRILLLGYFGADNFGDDALLADWLLRHVDWLQEHALTCDVLSRSATPLDNFVEAPRLRPWLGRCIANREALRLTVQDYSALVAPGGSLLQDATSLRSLLFYLWLLHRFQRAGRPTFLLNQGIGPLRSPLGAWLCAKTLRGARLVSVRDAESHAMLLRWPEFKHGPRPLLSADPILDAQFAAPAAAAGPPEPYALLIPKRTGDLPHPGDTTPEAAALGQLVEHLRRATGLAVHLLPFHAEQDRAFCAEVAAACGAAVLHPPAPTGTATWELLRRASLVVSYRLHGLVSAAAHGLPACGVAYDPKVSAFCEAAGLPWCYPAEVHHAEALQAITELWNSREETQQARQAARRAMLERLSLAESRFRELW